MDNTAIADKDLRKWELTDAKWDLLKQINCLLIVRKKIIIYILFFINFLLIII